MVDLFDDICEVCGNLEAYYQLNKKYFCSIQHYEEFREKNGRQTTTRSNKKTGAGKGRSRIRKGKTKAKGRK